jgi:hypothetical protein
MGFRTGDTTSTLKGQTITGQPFVGHDQVCIDCRSGHRANTWGPDVRPLDSTRAERLRFADADR